MRMLCDHWKEWTKRMTAEEQIRQGETFEWSQVEHKASGRASWRPEITSQWMENQLPCSSHKLSQSQALWGLSTRHFQNRRFCFREQKKGLAVLARPLEPKRLVLHARPDTPMSRFRDHFRYSFYTRITSALRFLHLLDFS
ncbi:hypothetical protein HBH56_028730 [Parastagonospora nodorum]|uniref:Uncharacterized protein n=1 Tax=Phaeosphaeria nodorum (strain SN15 / ATCC MYA-4574 / FGSC 10173) TaxID=321614 RepID=A0A7U2F5I5_PHANO|nr:hypothetical protein HBH56_028730 [Parastagonospora nodorum]QRC99137.1 hypothetical protein JI435_064770 [Parastagonospora nodorum SN15]KAH3934584.1 hypothetical protein HBH54_053310 [Parastagonospora nodorum]KAH4141917.1 hypothetical protein HBH45_063480 [Parastagonospora nodorum]KAH4150966.1 hypothetical protein HBH44_171780 [Parastagonospora nodorum]